MLSSYIGFKPLGSQGFLLHLGDPSYYVTGMNGLHSLKPRLHPSKKQDFCTTYEDVLKVGTRTPQEMFGLYTKPLQLRRR